ncbi:ATP-binding protein [Halobaculum sp. MBLA0143]|uniref:ATP-binding protein n=1 Tax=Halobaculum sp. MBLA0143 TaxID=3079933 RepID=UPI0035240F93
MTGVDPLVVVNVVAVAGLSVVGGLAAWRRSVPGAGALSAIAFLTAAQPSLQVVVLVASDVSPASVRLFAVVWRALPPLWLGFAAAYTGRGPALGPRWTALLAVVAVGWQLPGVLFELTGLVRLFLELGWVLLFVATAYSALLLWRATDDGGLSRRRAAGLLGACGTSVALFAAVLIPDGGAVASAGLSLATAGCLAVAVVDGALDRAPGTDHLARERLLAAMDEAAIVADRAGRLSDANAAARRVFDLGDDAFGRSVAAVVDAPLPDPDNPDRETVVVDTPDGRRELAVSATRVRDDRETVVGRTYLFGDVTERVTAERRLAVLGRVLRHNLRNDLDAVQAFAEALDDDEFDDDEFDDDEFDGEPGERGGSRAGDDPPDRAATHRRRIRDLAAGLADTGATVAEMERLFSRPSVREPAEPVAVADGVAARFDDHAGTVRVRAAGSPDELVTDPELLSTALAELVENGLEHADDPTPTVEVVVAATASGVAVAVHDEGPGIPAREREVLVAGEEPLRHGSGLGLWFVWLAVRRLGGELSFAERDGVGSVVTLTVPDRSVAE